MDAISSIFKKVELESVGKAVISGAKSGTSIVKKLYQNMIKRSKDEKQKFIQEEERIPLKQRDPNRPVSPKPPFLREPKKPKSPKPTQKEKQKVIQLKDNLLYKNKKNIQQKKT